MKPDALADTDVIRLSTVIVAISVRFVKKAVEVKVPRGGVWSGEGAWILDLSEEEGVKSDPARPNCAVTSGGSSSTSGVLDPPPRQIEHWLNDVE